MSPVKYWDFDLASCFFSRIKLNAWHSNFKIIIWKIIMYKNLFKFAVLSITILTAELVANLITGYLVTYKWTFKPLRFTLLSMAIIVIVFYPLLTQFEKWLNKFTKRFVKASHSYFGKYLGLLFMYLLALILLTNFYAQMWYDIDLIDYILDGKIVTLF